MIYNNKIFGVDQQFPEIEFITILPYVTSSRQARRLGTCYICVIILLKMDQCTNARLNLLILENIYTLELLFKSFKAKSVMKDPGDIP